jgi:serine/threonine protein kinase
MGRTERLAQPEEFGKYQLTARLAHGRMSDVYKAKSHGVEGFEKILVVKVINQALVGVPSFVDTVIEEAKRAVALSHANVVQVYDLGRTDDQDQFYIATEFINGFDLGRAMNLAGQSGSRVASGSIGLHRQRSRQGARLRPPTQRLQLQQPQHPAPRPGARKYHDLV